MVSALASQAAVAIENSRLYEDIERLFEGFVTAAVTAIESRDPATSGHSCRVATLTVGLAEAVDRGRRGSVSRRALHARAAARASLRRPAARLRQGRRARAGARESRRSSIRATSSSSAIASRICMQSGGSRVRARARRASARAADASAHDAAIERAARTRDRRAARSARTVSRRDRQRQRAHGPARGQLRRAARQINRQTYVDFDGVERPLLDDHELQFLMIRKGNLDDRERREIESHVTHTYRFLEQIPWTRELKGHPGDRVRPSRKAERPRLSARRRRPRRSRCRRA